MSAALEQQSSIDCKRTVGGESAKEACAEEKPHEPPSTDVGAVSDEGLKEEPKKERANDVNGEYRPRDPCLRWDGKG